MKFRIYGEPQGKARPRFTRSGHTYTPQATKQYEQEVEKAFVCNYGEITQNPVRIEILALYSIPKSYTKKQKEEIKAKKLLPTKKPDIDNIAKIILDGLNGIAYEDDKQVIELSVTKEYTFDEPFVEVEIIEIN